jgi:peptidoglycan/LPS O-acetylase OafA/YrhL
MLGAGAGAGLIVSLWLPWYTVRHTQSAWQTFTATPAVLVVIGAIAATVSILELSDRTGDASQIVALSGAVTVALVGYRIASSPGAGAVHASWGVYLAFTFGVMMLISGRDLAPLRKGLDREVWVASRT